MSCISTRGQIAGFTRHTNDTGSEIPIVANDFNKLLISFLTSAVCINMNRQRLSNSNSIRKLDKHPSGKACSNKRLGYITCEGSILKRRSSHTNPASSIGSRTIHLGEVLSRKGSTSVSTPASVCVDDDLAAC